LEKEELPEEWEESSIENICKKGDKADCNKYTGISFSSTTYKILSNILVTQIPPSVTYEPKALYIIAIYNNSNRQTTKTCVRNNNMATQFSLDTCTTGNLTRCKRFDAYLPLLWQ
jgi:hypothetical protein